MGSEHLTSDQEAVGSSPTFPTLTSRNVEAIACIVEAEVDRRYGRERVFLGYLERGDLVSAGWLGAVTGMARRADAGLGYLRLCIRGAIADELRREWRALGRVARSILWPRYWPVGEDTVGELRLMERWATSDRPRHRDSAETRQRKSASARRRYQRLKAFAFKRVA